MTPDGKYIVSGSSDRSIRLWDFKSRKCVHTFFGHDESVNSITVSPDSKLIVSGSSDGLIKVWDIESK